MVLENFLNIFFLLQGLETLLEYYPGIIMLNSIWELCDIHSVSWNLV